MNEVLDVKVGDRVVRNYRFKSNTGVTVGTVIKITPKRNDIVVDYGNYKETYDKFGYDKFCWTKGHGFYNLSRITLLTHEILEDIKQENLIYKCQNVFDKKKKDLTAEQAKRILEILGEGDD